MNSSESKYQAKLKKAFAGYTVYFITSLQSVNVAITPQSLK